MIFGHSKLILCVCVHLIILILPLQGSLQQKGKGSFWLILREPVALSMLGASLLPPGRETNRILYLFYVVLKTMIAGFVIIVNS